MLRKDTLHMIKNEWEPRIPKTEEIKRQMQKRQARSAGSVRAALGRVIGASEKSVSLYASRVKNK